jgi:hypothetical protein
MSQKGPTDLFTKRIKNIFTSENLQNFECQRHRYCLENIHVPTDTKNRFISDDGQSPETQ